MSKYLELPSRPRPSSQLGFSLLEMIVVLAIVLILSSAFFIILSDDAKEKEVVAIAEQIEAVFYQSKKASVVDRVDRTVTLDGKSFSAFERSSSEPTQSYRVPDPYAVEFNRELEGDAWRKADDKPTEFFFGKSGLNTPFSIRFSSSEATCEIQFNAVTGNPKRVLFIN